MHAKDVAAHLDKCHPRLTLGEAEEKIRNLEKQLAKIRDREARARSQ
jgi:hypothetical protein